jgi:hypothetical protein
MSVLKYYNTGTSSWETAIVGAQGDTGATGSTGPQGDTGATGSTGADQQVLQGNWLNRCRLVQYWINTLQVIQVLLE